MANALLHLNVLFCFRKRPVHRALPNSLHTKCLEGMGSVVVEDMGGSAALWSLAWAAFAAAAGYGLAVAATTLFRRMRDEQLCELSVGYNALAAFDPR